MAERLKLVVAKRRLSGPDEESNKRDTDRECTTALHTDSKRTSNSSDDSVHNESEPVISNREKRDNDSSDSDAGSMNVAKVTEAISGPAMKGSVSATAAMQATAVESSTITSIEADKVNSAVPAVRIVTTTDTKRRKKKGTSTDKQASVPAKAVEAQSNGTVPEDIKRYAVPRSAKSLSAGSKR